MYTTEGQYKREVALKRVKLENQRMEVLRNLGSSKELFEIIEEYVKSRRSLLARLGRVRFQERYTADGYGELAIITFIGEDGFSFALYMDMEGGWNDLNVYDNYDTDRCQLKKLYNKLVNAGFKVRVFHKGSEVKF